jgi:two-component system cell cycle response regulator DivK
MRILLVEDTQETRLVTRALLERLGHTVREAADGKQAVTEALRERPDLILMDLSMPNVDGLQATGALRAISTFRHVPIIAITAYPESLSREKAHAAGCDDYLQKPVDFGDLAKVIDKFSPTVSGSAGS